MFFTLRGVTNIKYEEYNSTEKDVIIMLGDNIKKLRRDCDMSQDELAEKLGVTRQSICLWENGQTQPSLDSIVTISKIFNVSTDVLLDTDNETPSNNETRSNNNDTTSDDSKKVKNVEKTKKENWKSVFIFVSIVLIVALALGGGYYHRDTLFNLKKELSPEKVYELASPATVEIQVETEEGTSTGTGFFDDNEGTIITNYHVIEGGDEGNVWIKSGKKYPIEKVIGYDKDLDIAIIKIDYRSEKILKWRTTDIITGEKVYAIGSSEGLTDSFSSGIISSVDRKIGDRNFIQTTAPISHGNSGGPLIDRYGEIIGITSAGIEEGQNLNLVIPIEDTLSVKRDLAISMADFYKVTNPRYYLIEDTKTIHKCNCIDLINWLSENNGKNYKSFWEDWVFIYYKKIGYNVCPICCNE